MINFFKNWQERQIQEQREHEQKLINFDGFKAGDRVREVTDRGITEETVIKVDAQNDEIVSVPDNSSIESHLNSRSFLYGNYEKIVKKSK